MDILITGATSFIGRPLLRGLLNNGHNVCAVVRKGSKYKDEFLNCANVTIVEADIEEYPNLANRLNYVFDVCVLLAWNGTRGADRSNEILQKRNYECNISLIHELCRIGCKKIITAGSQAEYGSNYQATRITEESLPNPNTQYGIYKLRLYMDALQCCRAHKVELIEPRFFSLYGPEDYEGTMIMSMLRNMLDARDCELTECTQLWDFLYIDDAVNGLVKIIERECKYSIYNFGFGDAKPLRSYIETMHRLSGSHSKICYGAIPYPETGIVHTNPDISRLLETGWQPKVNFSEGIRIILDQMTLHDRI